jgi:hypothetical protein
VAAGASNQALANVDGARRYESCSILRQPSPSSSIRRSTRPNRDRVRRRSGGAPLRTGSYLCATPLRAESWFAGEHHLPSESYHAVGATRCGSRKDCGFHSCVRVPVLSVVEGSLVIEQKFDTVS